MRFTTKTQGESTWQTLAHRTQRQNIIDCVAEIPRLFIYQRNYNRAGPDLGLRSLHQLHCHHRTISTPLRITWASATIEYGQRFTSKFSYPPSQYLLLKFIRRNQPISDVDSYLYFFQALGYWVCSRYSIKNWNWKSSAIDRGKKGSNLDSLLI